MLRRIVAATAGLLLVATTSASAQSSSGVNVGSLTCTVAGGVGFVFGSSKELTCLFNRTNGVAERYTGSIKKFGVDIGFTKEAQIVWLVFAPGGIGAGALSGAYAGATGSATVGVGRGCQRACWRKQQAGLPAAGQRRGKRRAERRGRNCRGGAAPGEVGLSLRGPTSVPAPSAAALGKIAALS